MKDTNRISLRSVKAFRKYKDSSRNTTKGNRELLPRRLLKLFAVAAVVLVPWSIWLSHSLPSDHLDRRWNIAWSGFDFGLLLSLGLTAYWGLRKSGWVIAASSIAGALLITDAWFDFLTAKQGWDYLVSTISAVFVELPLAMLAFWIAYRAGNHYFGGN